MSIGVEFKIDRLKFKAPEYRKALDDALYDAMLKVATVWVRTALVSVGGTFPVITGMAKGSFIELVRFLRGEGKKIAFNELEGINFDKVKPGVKSVTEGRKQSKRSNFVIVLRNQYGPFRYTFDWWTNVAHFIQNETDPEAAGKFHLIHDTPWNVRLKANAAAQAYLPTALRQLPKLKNYVEIIRSTGEQLHG